MLSLYRCAPVIALCAALAACATNGFWEPDNRQAIIGRIVAASAKIMLDQEGRRVASGSGVVIGANPDGQEGPVSYILTAAHLFDGRQDVRIFVRFSGGQASPTRHPARLLQRNQGETADLAILEVSGVVVEPAFLAEDGDAHLGAEIFAGGFPWGKRLGIFSCEDGSHEVGNASHKMVQIGLLSRARLGSGEGQGLLYGPDEALDLAVDEGKPLPVLLGEGCASTQELEVHRQRLEWRAYLMRHGRAELPHGRQMLSAPQPALEVE